MSHFPTPEQPDPGAKVPVPAEVIEQALRDFDDKATLEEVRRLRESGGLALGDFYGDLERLAHWAASTH